MSEIKQGYKQTEFGRIPKDWTLCSFKDVLTTFSSGATPYRGIPEYYKGSIRWISSGELNYNRITETIEHISELAVSRTNLKIHSEGTFLMAITGLEAAGTRGRCAIVGAPSATNQSCLAINGTDKMTTAYLFWFYKHWGDYLALKYCQGTKQQSYTASIAKELPICCPPTPAEQQAIASVLSDIDSLISALDKKIAKKQALKQGAMQQLLTVKKRLPGFTEPWVEKRIGDIGLIVTGSTPSRSVYDYWGNEFAWISAVDFQNKYIYDSKQKLTELGKGTCRILPVNSVLVTCIASIGLNAITKVECATNQQINAIVCNDYFCNEFVYYIMQINKQKLLDIAGQTAVPIISKNEFELFSVYVTPNKEEQQAIAQILTDMDKEIEQLQEKRNKYTALKQGAMQKLLTGQIRIKY